VPPAGGLAELEAQIPERQRRFANEIKEKYKVPDPKGPIALHQWGGLNQAMARAQLEVLLEERVPVIASGLGNPAFILEAAHSRGMKVFGLVGKTRQARKEIEAGVDAVVAQGFEAAGQGVGFVTAMKPARQILFDLVEEALDALEGVVGELA